ncbi:splicing factor, suppressor of white-apricot homolog isoform X2 [Tubulanus polymorphus]
MEKAAYEEEELKRLNEALMEDNSYGAVAFNYEDTELNKEQNEEEEKESTESDSDEENEPFVCPPTLKNLLPEDMYQPPSMKIHAIIEKTASFIGTHGPQMEIIIKMKQTNNPLFQFLVFGNALNPYYKFLVSLIKKKMYVPIPKEGKRKRKISSASQDSESGDENEGSYLHPSLLGSRTKTAAHNLNVQKYTLSSEQVKDTRFAKLLSRMNENAGRESPGISNNNSDSNSGYMTPPIVSSSSSYIESTSSYGQPPPPGTETTVLPLEQCQEYGDIEASLPPIIPPTDMIPPPPDMQPIIDKMADYVIRNGIEFEESMRRKNDVRFEFLIPGHFHHSYYSFKKQMKEHEALRERLIKEREEALRKEIAERKERDRLALVKRQREDEIRRVKQLAAVEDAEREALIAAGKASVSFSIKPKDTESVPLEKKPVFTYETSDEEGEGIDKHLPEMSITEEMKVEPVILQQPEYIMSETSQDTDASQEILEKRYAEEKLKDKLALAAREKLVQATKEKQLQVERKRKAALFINMLKTSNSKNEKPTEEKSEVAVPDISKVVENVVSSLIGASNENPSSSPIYTEPTTLVPHNSQLTRRFSVPENRSLTGYHRSRTSRSPERSRNSRSPRKRRSRTPPSSYHVSSYRSRSRSKSPRVWRRSKSKEKGRLPASYESQRGKSSAYERKQRSRSRSRTRSHHSKSKHKTKSPSKRHRSRSRSRSRKSKRSKSPTRSRNGSSKSNKSEKYRKNKSTNEDTRNNITEADSDSPLPNLSDVEEQNDMDTGAENKLSKEEIMNKMKVFREKVLKEEDDTNHEKDGS